MPKRRTSIIFAWLSTMHMLRTCYRSFSCCLCVSAELLKANYLKLVGIFIEICDFSCSENCSFSFNNIYAANRRHRLQLRWPLLHAISQFIWIYESYFEIETKKWIIKCENWAIRKFIIRKISHTHTNNYEKCNESCSNPIFFLRCQKVVRMSSH